MAVDGFPLRIPVVVVEQMRHSGCASWSGCPHAELLLADVSLAGYKLAMTLGFLGEGRWLAPRLQAEASRRG